MNVVGCFSYMPYSEAGQTATYSEGGYLVDCDFVLNAGVYHRWTTSGEYKIDVESVALHEFGHWLRLEDEYGVFEAVMYPYLGPGQVKRSLSQDDIDGIKHIYGAAGVVGCGRGGNGCEGSWDGGGYEEMQKVVTPAEQGYGAYVKVFNQIIAPKLRSDHPTAKKYANIIKKHQKELSRLASTDPEVIEQFDSFSREKSEFFESQLTASPRIVTRKEIDGTKRLLESLGKKASSSLKDDLTDFGRLVEKAEGKTIREAVDELFRDQLKSPQLGTEELLVSYPNPFNPISTIQYRLAGKTHVSLKVYDLAGREVATLVNQDQDKGTYEVRFDASNLSSGVYISRLTTNRGTTTRKMLLLK